LDLRLSFWPDVLILDYGWPVESSPAAREQQSSRSNSPTIDLTSHGE